MIKFRHSIYFAVCVVCIFISAVNISYAQEARRIKVVDESNCGVSCAIVLALNAKDSTVIRSIVTDNDGWFELGSTPGDVSGVLLDVSCSGYGRSFGAVPIDTDHIVIKSLDVKGGSIDDVVVEGKRTTFERSGDKYTFRISDKLEIVKSSTIYDILKLTPLVIVSDIDNTISVAGGSSSHIYINGRRNKMPQEALITYLQSMPATLLGSIDILPIANSTYAGDGIFSVININLKRNPDNGVSGMVNLSSMQSHSNASTLSTNINLRHDKLGANLSVWGRGQGNFRQEKLNNTLFVESNDRNITNSKTFSNGGNGGGSLNLDYDISDRQVIGVVVSASFARNQGYASSFTRYENGSGLLDSLYRSNIEQHNYDRNISANINYQLRTDQKGSTLNVDVDYVNYLRINYLTNVFDRLNNDSSYYYTLDKLLQRLPQQVEAWAAKVNYAHQFGRWGSLSVGGHFQSTKSEDNSYYASGEWSNNDANLSNHFVYNEIIPSLFASYSVQWNNKFSTTIGSKFEYTHTRADQRTMNESVKTNRFRVLPSLFLSYMPNANHSIAYTLSNAQQHPGYQFMNSFRIYSSPTSYSEGNPYLRPETQISNSIDYAYKGKLQVIARNIFRENLAVRDFQPYGESGLKETVINLGYESQTSLLVGMTGMYFNDYLMANNFVGYTHGQQSGVSAGEHFKEYYNIILVSLNNTVVLSKKHQWLLGVSYMFHNGIQSGRTNTSDFDYFQMSITKNWPRWNLKVSYSDSFDSLKSNSTTTNTSKIHTVVYTLSNPRVFNVYLSYKFGKQIRSTRQRSTSSDEIKGRL